MSRVSSRLVTCRLDLVSWLSSRYRLDLVWTYQQKTSKKWSHELASSKGILYLLHRWQKSVQKVSFIKENLGQSIKGFFKKETLFAKRVIAVPRIGGNNSERCPNLLLEPHIIRFRLSRVIGPLPDLSMERWQTALLIKKNLISRAQLRDQCYVQNWTAQHGADDGRNKNRVRSLIGGGWLFGWDLCLVK